MIFPSTCAHCDVVDSSGSSCTTYRRSSLAYEICLQPFVTLTLLLISFVAMSASDYNVKVSGFEILYQPHTVYRFDNIDTGKVLYQIEEVKFCIRSRN